MSKPSTKKPGTDVAVKPAASTPAVYDAHIANLPAELRAKLQADAEQMKDRIAKPTGDKIRLTKKQTFKLPDGRETEPGGTLDVVVIDFTSFKAFFDKPYAEGEAAIPACFALGSAKLFDLVPSPSSPDKQNEKCGRPQGDGCCPNNEFGSKGKGKACSDHYLLGVVENSPSPDAPLYLIQVPPKSLKDWESHVAQIQAKHGLGPIAVRTEVRFDPDSEYQRLKFGILGANENIAVHAARLDEVRTRLKTEPDVSGYAKPQPKGPRRR